jgi:hypothetical protein
MALFTATPARRRLVMIVLLLMAASGGVIRHFAANPSTLRDIGTLLLVLWLPAVGNLVAYLIRKIPRRPPPVTTFAAAFAPQLQVRLQAVDVDAQARAALDSGQRLCTLVVGRRGFTARGEQPVARMLATAPAEAQELELLHPGAALGELQPGTGFHLLVGRTAVATGSVLAAVDLRQPSSAPPRPAGPAHPPAA